MAISLVLFFYKDKEVNSLLVCLELVLWLCYKWWKDTMNSTFHRSYSTSDNKRRTERKKLWNVTRLLFLQQQQQQQHCDSMPTLGKPRRRWGTTKHIGSDVHVRFCRSCCKHNLFRCRSFCWSWLDWKEKEGARNKAAVSPGLYWGAEDRFRPGFLSAYPGCNPVVTWATVEVGSRWRNWTKWRWQGR